MKNVDFIYPNGTHAIKNISLNIDKREFLAIMGQNGAGKTTLIRTLNGLLRILLMNYQLLSTESTS